MAIGSIRLRRQQFVERRQRPRPRMPPDDPRLEQDLGVQPPVLEAEEAVAVAGRRVVVAGLLDRVRFPVRRLVPEIPGQDVRFTVPVKTGAWG